MIIQVLKEEIAGRIRFTIPLRDILPLSREQSRKRSGPESGAESRAGSGAESRLEYTLPDKPNSRLQKYRLTPKGKQLLEARK